MKSTEMHPIIAGAPVVVDDIVGNNNTLATALDGVEFRQLPADSVGVTEVGGFDFLDFYNPVTGQTIVQSGFSTLTENHYFVASVHTPDVVIEPSDSFSSGWNRLADLDGGSSYVAKSIINFPSCPGRILGFATVDSELRCSVSSPYPSNDPYPNKDLWWQFAVFANGSLLAMSPKLYAGRHTVTIPFFVFSGAEEIQFDIRARFYFGKQQYQDATARNVDPFALHNYQLWATGTSK